MIAFSEKILSLTPHLNQQDCFDGVKSLMEGTSTSKLNYSENKLLSFYRDERIFQHFNPCAFKTARR